mgnify:CR=1 FL=1
MALKVDQYNGPEYREKGKEEDVVIDNSSDSDKPKRSASGNTNKNEDGENRLISFFADSRLRIVLSTIMILLEFTKINQPMNGIELILKMAFMDIV